MACSKYCCNALHKILSKKHTHFAKPKLKPQKSMTVIRLISCAEQFKHKENLFKVTATHTWSKEHTRHKTNFIWECCIIMTGIVNTLTIQRTYERGVR